ncbi:MAG: AAA family ATPase [Candidatus Thermoplasmatota archaeon]|nr:AAA family ATPase [Candidatus Thermoplasmatota archaeon]
MKIYNFKGIQKFEFRPDGENAVVRGVNGAGKTSIYDAFLYLLFGKDSTGRKDFEIRPLDKSNQPIPKLTLEVEAEIVVDGVAHVLRKQQQENVVKGELRGYNTLCWIDDVPKKVSEYAEYISDLVSDDTFKALTNLHHFNGLHWKERRAILMEIAGQIQRPSGFDELLANLKGRTVDDYKHVLVGQKKLLEKERNDIPPRIDELQRGLEGYAGDETPDLFNQDKRTALQAEIKKLDDARLTIVTSETERQERIDNLNTLKVQLTSRECELRNDVSAVRKYYDEKQTIQQRIADKRQQAENVKGQISLAERSLKNDQDELQGCIKQRQRLAEQYKALSSADFSAETCSACGQVLPADKIDSMKKKAALELQAVNKQGAEVKQDIDNCNASIQKEQGRIAELQERLAKLEIELQEGLAYQATKFVELDKLIACRPGPVFSEDEKWQSIKCEIDRVQESIGESASVQLHTIEADRTAKQAELNELNRILAQADRVKQDAARIKELELRETEIAQQIADIDKHLADIEAYKTRESEMLEEAVNGRFKYVRFKMFNTLLNGGQEDACEATLNGVPYSDMSYGQKILVGIDIVNVLSAHYGMSIPLFIDNSESMTLPIESTSQTVRLMADPKSKKLKVETVKQEAAAA